MEMPTERDHGPSSDAEASEKPVREQLKKASIAGQAEITQDVVTAAGGSGTNDSAKAEDDITRAARPQPQRKRSFEEVEGERAGHPLSERQSRHHTHTRKRSRDSTAEEDELNNGQRKVSGERPRESIDFQRTEVPGSDDHISGERPGTPELKGEASTDDSPATAIVSPKTKRSRLYSSELGNNTLSTEQPARAGSEEAEVAEKSTNADTVFLEPTVKKVPPSSGFANTSAVSPFGALGGRKSPSSEPIKTSSNAFAASGFSALSGSSSSGFGAIGKTSGGFGAGGGFGTASKSQPKPEIGKENGTPKEGSSSTFGGALGQKSAFATGGGTSGGFGSGTSAFGQLGQGSGAATSFGGSGFGSLGGVANGGLSTFASGKPSASLTSSSKPARAFGTPAEDEDDDDNGGESDEAGFKSPLSQEEEKQDGRFYYQELETGEEDERLEYSCRAKLYNFVAGPDGKKEWRERGLGVLRLNVNKGDAKGAGSTKPKARFLMRAEGSHRVVLNTPIKKEIKFGAPDGGPPQGSYMYFMGAIDGTKGLELLQLKTKAQFAMELYEKIAELKQDM